MRLVWRIGVPLVLLAGLAVYFWYRTDAHAILARAIRAHGGQASAARCQIGQIKVKGKQGWPPSIAFEREETFHLPGRLKRVVREELIISKQQRRRISVLKDGVWRDRVDDGAIQTRPAKDGDDRDLLPITVTVLLRLRDDPFHLSKLEPVSIEGRPADGILVKAAGEHFADLYFDQESHLLVKMVKQLDAGSGILEFVYQDYESIDGILLPRRIQIYHDGNRTEQLGVLSARFPAQIDDSIFESVE